MSKTKKRSKIALEPSQVLEFFLPTGPSKGTEKNEVTAKLTISNPTSSNIKFKVKTTAPKKYCVKPNSGELEPNSHETVAVMLQPDPKTKAFPKAIADCRDKFLVQTVSQDECVQEHWFSPELWKLVPAEKIMSDKMKCTWTSSDTATTSGAGPAQERSNLGKERVRDVDVVAPHSPEVRAPSPAAPTAVEKERRASPAAASTSKPKEGISTAVKTADGGVDRARMYLLFVAFLIGLFVGKFMI